MYNNTEDLIKPRQIQDWKGKKQVDQEMFVFNDTLNS